MAKLRSVSTSFWSDPFIEDLSPSEKLLYLYLITNERTNMLGVYELSIKKMAFETGLDKSSVDKALKKFSKDGKVVYSKNYVLLLNFAKHQNYNTNMKKSAIDVYNNLPKELKVKDIEVDKSNPSEGFERVLKGLGMVRKVEVEVEDEDEDEDELQEDENFQRFWNLYNKKTGKITCLKKWSKLTAQEQNAIIDHLPKYVNATPNTKYRKNPLTYLNNRTWEDEELPNQDSEDYIQKNKAFAQSALKHGLN